MPRSLQPDRRSLLARTRKRLRHPREPAEYRLAGKRLSAGVLGALLLVAGCATPEPSVTTFPSITTAPPTTAPPTTTTAPSVLVPAASFEEAGAQLLQAWRSGDR